jgi:hypothetical protein
MSSDIVPFVDYFDFVLLYLNLTTTLRQKSNLFTSVFASLRERKVKNKYKLPAQETQKPHARKREARVKLDYQLAL